MKMPIWPATTFQNVYTPNRKNIAWTLAFLANSCLIPRFATRPAATAALSVFQIADSAIPCLMYQVMNATTNRCRKMIRLPSSPSGPSTTASRKPMVGPMDHANWADPTCAARCPAGAFSAM